MSSPTYSPVRNAAIAAFLACLPAGHLRAQAPASEWHSGASFQRKVSGAEPDRLRILLPGGQLIRLEVGQAGVDLIVSLRDPAGQVVTEVDSGHGKYGPETVSAVTESPGEYTLEVRRTIRGGHRTTTA